MWADFHWLRPEYFWLLLPTVLIWGLFAKLRRPQSAWQHWIAPHLQKRAVNSTCYTATKTCGVAVIEHLADKPDSPGRT